MIRERAHNAVPMPWRPLRIYDEKGWAHTVISSEGQSHDRYEVDRNEGAFLAALSAIAPEAMEYVHAASLKGGIQAVQIMQRFEQMIADVENRPRPEDRKNTA